MSCQSPAAPLPNDAYGLSVLSMIGSSANSIGKLTSVHFVDDIRKVASRVHSMSHWRVLAR